VVFVVIYKYLLVDFMLHQEIMSQSNISMFKAVAKHWIRDGPFNFKGGVMVFF